MCTILNKNVKTEMGSKIMLQKEVLELQAYLQI